MIDDRTFARRVLIAVGIAAVAIALGAVLTHYPYIPLVMFVAILLAVLLDGISRPLRHRLRLSRTVAVSVVTVVALGILALAIWGFGPQIATQSRELSDRLPQALNRLEDFIIDKGWAEALFSDGNDDWDSERLMAAVGGAWKPVAGAFATAFAGVSGTLIVLIIGFFLALHLPTYVAAVVSLFRHEARGHIRELLHSIGHALRWWLVGQFATMALVAALTTIGLHLLGVPLATLLGIVAGLFSFIPFLGPILSAVPAVLVALVESPQLALYVVLLFTGVQFIEGNVASPLIQARAVSLPPAALILSQLLMGGLFGLLGVLVATPLTVAVIVSVQFLYVRDVLDDDVELMGERRDDEDDDEEEEGEGEDEGEEEPVRDVDGAALHP